MIWTWRWFYAMDFLNRRPRKWKHLPPLDLVYIPAPLCDASLVLTFFKIPLWTTHLLIRVGCILLGRYGLNLVYFTTAPIPIFHPPNKLTCDVRRRVCPTNLENASNSILSIYSRKCRCKLIIVHMFFTFISASSYKQIDSFRFVEGHVLNSIVTLSIFL